MNEKIKKILTDYQCFTDPNVIAAIYELPDEEVTTIGLALVKQLAMEKEDHTKHYMHSLWRAARLFIPWIDSPLSLIGEKELEESFEKEDNPYMGKYAKRLERKMIASALTRNWSYPNEDNYRFARKKFLNGLSFPEDYIVDENVSFKEFAEYWIFTHQSKYSKGFLKNNIIYAYKKLRPVYYIPYKDVTTKDIERLLEDELPRTKNAVHHLYARLENFACALGIIDQARYCTYQKTRKLGPFTRQVISDDGQVIEEMISVRKYIKNLYFPEDYICPKDITLIDLAMYWFFLNGKKLSRSSWNVYLVYLGYLNPWFEIPFRKLSVEKIPEQVENLPKSMRRGFTNLLYQFDKLAFEQGVVNKLADRKSKDNELTITYRNARGEKRKKRVSNTEYINSLDFSKNFHCSKNMTLKQVAEYWFFTHRDEANTNKFYSNLCAYKYLSPLWNKKFSMIDLSDIEELSDHKPKILRFFRILDFFANEQGITEKRKTSTYGKVERELTISARNTNGDLIQKPITNQSYLDHLYFPKNFTCERNMRFKTVFDYWLFLNRDEFKEKIYLQTILGSFRSLKPLHHIPFCKIRKEDILKLTKDQPLYKYTRIIELYRQLDWFAYLHGIIPTRYSGGLKVGFDDKKQELIKVLSDAQIKTLMEHKNEKGVDILLTAIFTGARTKELIHLNVNDLEENFVHLHYPDRDFSHRYIPLNEEQISIVKNAISTIQNICYGTDNFYLKEVRIRGKLKKASIRILGEPVTLANCRQTFDNRLFVKEYSMPFANYLRGTEDAFVSPTYSTYRHYDKESTVSLMKGRPLYEI